MFPLVGLSSGGAEAALTAPGLRQFLHHPEGGMEHGHDHQLGDAVAALHGVGGIGGVVEGHVHLSPVVAVDHTDAVGEVDAVFHTHTAANRHDAHISLGNGGGDPCGDHHARVGLDGHTTTSPLHPAAARAVRSTPITWLLVLPLTV